jgi:hypothetical protein
VDYEIAADIAEIVGAIAVVISLMYLAMQIREQTKQARSAAMHDMSVGFRDVVAGFGEASVAKLFIKGRESVDELADDELLQLLAHCQCLFRFWEEAYYLYLSGKLEGETWAGMNRLFLSMMSVKIFGHAWEMRREYYGDVFRQMIDESSKGDWQLR